ncbi:MAG: pepsin-like aspartyl protease [bacterium]
MGPLFVDALAAAKEISDQRFSFSMGYGNDTFVDFGVPQESAMSNKNDIRDIYVENDFFWSAYSQGIAFNDTKLDNSFGYVDGQMVYSIFDTGSSGILLSSDYYESIVNKLFQDYLKTMNFVIKDGVVFSQCFSPSQLPTLHFLFNELWI